MFVCKPSVTINLFQWLKMVCLVRRLTPLVPAGNATGSLDRKDLNFVMSNEYF